MYTTLLRVKSSSLIFGDTSDSMEYNNTGMAIVPRRLTDTLGSAILPNIHVKYKAIKDA